MNEELIYNKPVTVKNIMFFTIPTIIRMIFVSMYTIVDGIVVSNFVGSLGLSAINIVYPVLNIGMGVCFMFQTGSKAVMAKKMGEGKLDEANSFMSCVVILNLLVIFVLAGAFMIWDDEMYLLMGADDELLPYCLEYGRILIPACMIWVLQILFQGYLVTADKARISLFLSVAAGIVNIVLDIVFVGILDFGVGGAAAASVAGIVIGGTVPLFVFFNKKQMLHFEKPSWNIREILLAMGNGSSEMVINLSSALTTVIFNLQMMKLVGEKGVAAISAILYIQFIFAAIHIGFTDGIAPVISYNYGAENHDNIKKLFRISIQVVFAVSILMILLAEVLCVPVTLIFASKDPVLEELMVHGFRIFAINLGFVGAGIFASGFFTALNNGKASAFVSIMRTLVFETITLLILPEIWGLDGVWWALPLSEFLAAMVSVIIIVRYRDVYGYRLGKSKKEDAEKV